MSRYVLIPNSNTFDLIPLDQSLQKKNVIVPDNLFMDMGVFDRVQDKVGLQRLLNKLSRTGISRMNNGNAKDNNTCLNISFEEGLVSCCDGNFKKEYDDFYSVLKYNGIHF